jgi:hypothetical protein
MMVPGSMRRTATAFSFPSIFAFDWCGPRKSELLRQLQSAELNALDRTRFDSLLLVGIQNQDLSAPIFSHLGKAFGE